MQLFLYFQIYIAANRVSSRLPDEATGAFKIQFHSQENIAYLSLDNASANTKGCTCISRGRSLTSTQLNAHGTSFIMVSHAAPRPAFCTHYVVRYVGLHLFFYSFDSSLSEAVSKFKGMFSSQPIWNQIQDQQSWVLEGMFFQLIHKYTFFSQSLVRATLNFKSGSVVHSQKLQKDRKRHKIFCSEHLAKLLFFALMVAGSSHSSSFCYRLLHCLWHSAYY